MCVCVRMWKMVHDKVACDQVVRACVRKMVCVCDKDLCGRWYVLKMVCDKNVCERWCVTKMWVCGNDVCP